MKKIIITVFVYIPILFVIKVNAFDPAVALQVSKRITEWKLVSNDKNETQVESIVYVSSSLDEIVKKGEGNSKGIGIVNGLRAFESDNIESQIRKFEQNKSLRMSVRYTSRLPSNPSLDIASDFIINVIGTTFQSPMASVIYNVASMTISATTTGMETIDYFGTSMQIMNPSVYLNKKISWGWEGQGFYHIQNGHVYYQEILKTGKGKLGPITRIHTDLVRTNTGIYIRHIEIKTPATSSFERFMINHYPVGSYWDPQTSTMKITTKSIQSYCVKTYGGISKVIPEPIYTIDVKSFPKNNWAIPNTISFPKNKRY